MIESLSDLSYTVIDWIKNIPDVSLILITQIRKGLLWKNLQFSVGLL